MALFAALLLASALIGTEAAISVPGVVPKVYGKNGDVAIEANKLMSTKTQTPYDYYTLPYCQSDVQERSENLGQRLAGDKLESSGYKARMQVPRACMILCQKDLSSKEARKFRNFIDDEYRVSLVLDTLPVTMTVQGEDEMEEPYSVRGYPVGFVDESSGHKRYYLYNHLRFTIYFNEDPAMYRPDLPGGESQAHVVGFEVVPISIKHQFDKRASGTVTADTVLETCNEMHHASNQLDTLLSIDGPTEVIFTYDLIWQRSDLHWTERWDVYLRSGPADNVHWFSIINSALVTVFLAAMVAMILIRALRRDILAYNEDDDDDSGWKLMHTEVFRPPTYGKVAFSVIVGTGIQVTLMIFATLAIAIFGIISPANRGYLVTSLLVFYAFMGTVAGYFSARTYKMFRGTNWRLTTVFTATAFPGFCFVCFFIVDMALAAQGSSAAVPALTWFTLIAMCFGVSVPLVFAGSYKGYREDLQELPCRVNLIARKIPEQPWYFHPVVVMACGGILPFAAVSVELFFLMSAIWLNQLYYIFGFLLMTMIILVITCAELSIVVCYFQLCSANHRWWWNSIVTPGASGLYVLAFSMWYYLQETDISEGVPSLIYFVYMILLSTCFFLVTGSSGYLATLAFVKAIFSSVKVD
uniref:Transmembrane 9 superfamily member n=1 Tax=Pinguiococcus pyrenoidosus TaxID=172671 RepID=A0A7R9U668_9STRA